MPYLTPNSIPEDDDCRPLSIPADPVWLALFGGALTELTKPYNWQKFGDLTVEETISKMQSIIDNWYDLPCAACTTPGGYRVIRIGSDGRLEQLDEDGNWEPATDEYFIPPPPAREGGEPSDQICLAATNAVSVLRQLYEGLSESFASELSEAEAITAFIALAIALIGFEFAPITWAIAAFFLAVFEVLYSAIRYVTADLWDDAVSDQFICFLVACASNDGGVVTFDWVCFNQHLNSLADSFGLSEVQLRLYAQVGYLLYFIGGVDGLNLAGGTTEIESADCSECDAPWCRMYDFRLDAYGFEVINAGTYVFGVGFDSDFVYDAGSDSSARYVDIANHAFFASVTHIEFGFAYTKGSVTGGGGNSAILLSDTTFTQRFFDYTLDAIPPVPDSPLIWDFSVDPEVITSLDSQLITGILVDTNSDPGGVGTIIYIKMCGVGEPPAGGVICDPEECE